MNILVACEESQAVTKELRRLGHIAFSCDIQDPSGGRPDWHIKGDVIKYLEPGNYFARDHDIYRFCNEYGYKIEIPAQWDMIIGFPPCTYLSHAAAGRHTLKNNSLEYINKRTLKRVEAAVFFMKIATADCERIAIENPLGIMSTVYRKPDQIINPYDFGDPVAKRTCLWLKNLPPLMPTYKQPPQVREWVESMKGSGAKRQKARSKTFPGIAQAMAEQWTNNFFL